MLYVPPPYSSGTHLSACEQAKYTITTPPSPPTALVSSDLHYHHQETSTTDISTKEESFRESPPLTPRRTSLEVQDPGSSLTTDTHFYMDQGGEYLAYNGGFEEKDTLEDDDDLKQQQQRQGEGYLYEPFYDMEDDYFESANRAFHATINKFSRQNYPENRKRNIYNFLENWHLHSMYSKSQQILLGIPHVRPMVLLSGDDFMFTPPLLQDQQQQQQQQHEHSNYEEDDEGDDYYADQYCYQQQQLGYLDQPMEWIDDDDDGDGHMFDEGNVMDDVVIMSAPDPPLLPPTLPSPLSPVLNENAWMKNHITLISESSLLLDGNDSIYRQQQNQQEGSCFSSESCSPLGEITSELLHWYRTSDRGRPPSTIMEKYVVEDSATGKDYSNQNNDKAIKCEDHHSNITPISSYQSLADIVNQHSPSSSSSHDLPPPHYYGSIEEQKQDASPSTVITLHHHHIKQGGLKGQLMAASDIALAMASDYRLEGKKTTRSFIRCMFQIWQVFMLTAENVLLGLWGQPHNPPPASSSLSTKSLGAPVDVILPF